MIPHSQPWITDADREAVAAVLTTPMIAQGDVVRRFEQMIATSAGAAGGVAVASGTAALTLALRGLRVEGREVVVPTYACRNVAEAVATAGGIPVPCDVGDAWNMTPETVRAVMSPRTAVIVVVHTFGTPAAVREFERLGLPIVEDACQAFGADVEGRPAGGHGVIGVFSFHATKCLTTGEGGMAVSRDPALVATMRRLRDGEEGAASPRLPSPMTDLQAALGLSQLARYDAFRARRRAVADRYFEALGGVPVSLPHGLRQSSMFFRFPVRVRGDVTEGLRVMVERGVQARRGMDALLHRSLGPHADRFPGAERLFEQTVSLPIYPALTSDAQRAVVEAFMVAHEKGRWDCTSTC